MSTEKNEISLDPSNMSLEEQAKLQTETQAVVANDETRVEVSEVDNTNKSTDDVRPNWLPEKFKSAEDMAKAYSELEKKQSTETTEEPNMQQMRADAEASEGMNKFYNEYQDKGELSQNSYDELSKMGLDKSLVDGYIAGQQSIANTEVQQIHNTVGGEENYSKVIEFAQTLGKAEQDAFNETLDTGSIEQVKMAVTAIASRAGINADQPQTMINGDSIEVNSDTFESSAQVIDAMNDPRYAKDPAFRKLVEEKIARSTAI